MPKKSLADVTTLRPDSAESRHLLLPGSHVSDDVSAIFAEIVGSVSVGHFSTADRALIEQYAAALHIAREIAAHIAAEGVVIDGKVSAAAKAHKQQAALCGQLASRLRLTPQNRISKDRATTTARGGAASVSEIYDRAGGNNDPVS